MEAAGGTGQRGPFTSTPREPPPPLDPPKRTDSSTSLSSDSSGEDWLIKVCCPGARHRYRRPVELKKPRRTGFSHSLDKEDDFTETAGGMPLASYQTYPGVPRQESSDLQWLIRLRCPRAQMEERMPGLKQSLPEISTNLSNSPSKTLRSSQSEWANASENWLTQKNIFTAQGSAFLESYSPSTYDPLFLKTCTDIWKASIPHLCDPLLKEIQGRYIEAGIIQQCDTGKIFSSKEMNELHKAELPLLPLSRQLMNPIEWLKIPAGYMESEIRQKSRRSRLSWIHLHSSWIPAMEILSVRGKGGVGREQIMVAGLLARQKMITTRNLSSMDFKNWGDSSWLPRNKRGSSTRKSDFSVCPVSWQTKY
ncbi:uncharacterized protein LOC128339637 isoform X5 [Hemicordylus capensis]|uniref:uncharacterized protein LOC128339637 isoform X5 n=1 Tax=Hemicordylus capensis TaxID=884348 RepID=UPI0023023949|nr:uncharacterized protein LOC128339637 isoform X5 [Hemicordylus capensis]